MAQAGTIYQYAHVLDGVVTNIIDAPNGFTPTSGSLVVLGHHSEDGRFVPALDTLPDIGWLCDGSTFANPHVVTTKSLAQLANYLSSVRYNKETEGIVVEGRRVGTNRATQAALANIVVPTKSENTIVSYKTNDGFLRRTAKEFAREYDAVQAHVQRAFKAEHVVMEKILAKEVTTFEQVDIEYTAAFTNNTDPKGDTPGF